MINPAPYNAEAPPSGLADEITPTELHYVRSNFPLPTHDGTLEITGAVGNPITLTLEDLRALPAHRARGDPGMRRQRTSGNAATADRGALGRLRSLHRPLEGCPAQRRAGPGGPSADGTDVKFEGADHGAYHLNPSCRTPAGSTSTFERALPLALAADPAAQILIAYEMNGEPLGPDHGAPFRVVVPHWYAVASVKWLKRIEVLTEPFVGEFQTGHYMYQWPDRPQEVVSLMRVRARITDPPSGSILDLGPCTVRGKAWSGQGPVTSVEVSLTGEGDWHPAQLEPPTGPVPLAGLDLRLGYGRRREAHAPRQGHRRGRQRATGSATVESARVRQQRHRGHLRRPPLISIGDERPHTTFSMTADCSTARAIQCRHCGRELAHGRSSTTIHAAQ